MSARILCFTGLALLAAAGCETTVMSSGSGAGGTGGGSTGTTGGGGATSASTSSASTSTSSTSASTSSTSSTSTTSGAGGGMDAGPACAPDEKTCSGACVKIADPLYGCTLTSCNSCLPPGSADTAVCLNGACKISCQAGHADCNKDPSDGCESPASACAGCPGPPPSQPVSATDCSAGFDPTKNGGDLLWVKPLYFTTKVGFPSSQCTPFMTVPNADLAALGPTGDIAVRGGCYITGGNTAYVGRYNMFGDELSWAEPPIQSIGQAYSQSTFSEANDLLSMFQNVSYGSSRTAFVKSTAAPWTWSKALQGTLPEPFQFGGDGKGNAFVVVDGSPQMSNPVIPVAGKYLMRTGTMGDSSQAGYSGSFVPDRTGGVLRYGPLQSTLDLGCGPMSGGATAGYLARLDPSWSCVYSRALPFSPTVVAAADGGAIVSGTSSTGADLGCGALPAAPAGSTFVTHLDPSGGCVFGKALSAPSLAVAVDPTGKVIVSGSVGAAAIDLGGGPLAPIGANDFVIASYDAAGNHLWSRRLGGANVAFVSPTVYTTMAGDVYFKTTFTGNADLGGSPLTATSNDTVVASYSPTGAHRWSRVLPLGGSSAVDACGSLVMVITDPQAKLSCGQIIPTPDPLVYPNANLAVVRFAR